MNDPLVVVFDLDETITHKDTTIPFVLGFLKDGKAARLRLPLSILSAIWAFVRQGQKKNLLLGLGLAGSRRRDVEAYAERFVDALFASGLNPNALKRIEEHRQAGHFLVLASASWDLYVEPIAKRLGFHQVICTKTAWKSENLLGLLDGRNCKGVEKARRLTALIAPDRLAPGIAYSDSFSDLPLLTMVDQGIIICKPGSSKERRARSLGIKVQDWI